MIHTTENAVKQHTTDNIQCVCNQIQADIDAILREQDTMNENERFKNLHKINELKQILSTIEDIDRSLNTLLSKEIAKHPPQVL